MMTCACVCVRMFLGPIRIERQLTNHYVYSCVLTNIISKSYISVHIVNCINNVFALDFSISTNRDRINAKKNSWKNINKFIMNLLEVKEEEKTHMSQQNERMCTQQFIY